MNVGGMFAHIGIALFFLGVIGSAKYSEEVNLSLQEGTTQEAFGYKFSYTGATPFMDANNKRDTMYAFNINVEKDNKEMTLRPVMFFSKFSNGIMKSPDIAYFSYKDLYLSPMSLEEPQPYPPESVYNLKKGSKTKINELEVEFVDFDFGTMQKGGKEMASGNYTLGAILKVNDGVNTETLNVKTQYEDGNPNPTPFTLQNNKKYVFYFLNMSVKGEEAGGTTASVAILDPTKVNTADQKETLVVAASIKPFISVLWSGVVIMFAGFILSIVRRRKDLMVKFPKKVVEEKKETKPNNKNSKKK
jgi:cytochrome c-type biogenesis protein CcmF